MSYEFDEMATEHGEQTDELVERAIEAYRDGELDDDQAADISEALDHQESLVRELESALATARDKMREVERRQDELEAEHEAKLEREMEDADQLEMEEEALEMAELL